MIEVTPPKFEDSPYYHFDGKKHWLDNEAPEELKKEFKEYWERRERLRKAGIAC